MTTGTKIVCGLSVLGWSALSVFWIVGVVSSYQRGHGSWILVVAAFVLFAVSVGSLGLPMLLVRRGRTGAAFAVALMSLVALLPLLIGIAALLSGTWSG